MANNTATFAWNPNTEPDLGSYILYIGQYPGIYPTFVQIGFTETSYVWSSFSNDGRWYFALAARDLTGNESAKTTPASKHIVRTQAYLKASR